MQEVVGRDQNLSSTPALSLRLRQAPAGQPPLRTAQADMCQSECARLSLPPRSCVCQFSSLNFVVPLGHIYCRTTGKGRKHQGERKQWLSHPAVPVNSGVLCHCASCPSFVGLLFSAAECCPCENRQRGWLSTALWCTVQFRSCPTFTCSVALGQMVCPSGPVYLVGK